MSVYYYRSAELPEKANKVIIIAGDNTPYCLCHKMEPRASTLETKQCIENSCSHLTFVKEKWTYKSYGSLKK